VLLKLLRRNQSRFENYRDKLQSIRVKERSNLLLIDVTDNNKVEKRFHERILSAQSWQLFDIFFFFLYQHKISKIDG
jgi:hypothetical protein